jgi:hypothetical protein
MLGGSVPLREGAKRTTAFGGYALDQKETAGRKKFLCSVARQLPILDARTLFLFVQNIRTRILYAAHCSPESKVAKSKKHSACLPVLLT